MSLSFFSEDFSDLFKNIQFKNELPLQYEIRSKKIVDIVYRVEISWIHSLFVFALLLAKKLVVVMCILTFGIILMLTLISMFNIVVHVIVIRSTLLLVLHYIVYDQ